jgi:signal transduction histidine kinase
MRKRIRAISTGGVLFIQSAPGRGTTVRVELTVPPPSGTAA